MNMKCYTIWFLLIHWYYTSEAASLGFQATVLLNWFIFFKNKHYLGEPLLNKSVHAQMLVT